VIPRPVATALLFACSGDAARARYEAAATAPNAAMLEVALARIDDPVVRDAAILTWVAAHRDDLPADDARALCGRVSPTDAPACLRRVDAAHLGR
jgi:hypothetical protein